MKLLGFWFAGLAGILMQGIYAQSGISWVGALPGSVQESSGLLLVGDRFITHNDSGNNPELFVLDTTSLEVVRRVRITNGENTDWEDLAQDADFIYIGDIGNNLGNRRDLKVLRISKEALSRTDAVEAAVISFSYEDQADFGGSQNSDWDAEALLSGPDSLYIFTKQWQTGGSVAYRIPKEPGQYQALRTAEYPAGGLITGASPIPGQQAFVLLGYSRQLQPFLLEVSAKFPVSGAAAATQKVQLDIPFAQAEGITVLASGEIYLSTEAFSNRLITLPAGVFRSVPGANQAEDSGGENSTDQEEGAPGSSGDLVLYQPSGAGTLRYRLSGKTRMLAKAIFDVTGRRVCFEEGEDTLFGEIDVSGLRSAVYYLTIYLPGRRVTRSFLRL